MPRLGNNGGLMGLRRVPSTGSASGVWDSDEQNLAKRAGIWPSTKGLGIYSQSSVYPGTTPASREIMTDGSFTNAGAATNGTSGEISWIKIDYGALFNITSVTIGTATNNIPGGWSISYSWYLSVQASSDDSTWTNLFTFPAVPAEGIYTFTAPSDFAAVDARFIRLAKANGFAVASEFYAG